MSPDQAKKTVLMGGKVNHFPNFPQRLDRNIPVVKVLKRREKLLQVGFLRGCGKFGN